MSENRRRLSFQSLEFPGTPWTRWASGFGINAAIVIALVLIPAGVERALPTSLRMSIATLIAPPPIEEKTVKPVVTHVVVKPPPEAVTPPPPKPEIKPAALPPVRAAAPVPPQVIRLEPPRIEPPKIDAAVRPFTSVPPVSLEVPKPVQVGGFGNPDGAAPSAASTNKGPAAPAVGAFDAPAGEGMPAGPRRSGQLVASAGFGNSAQGAAPGGTGAARGAVHGAGFGDFDQPATPSGRGQAARSTAAAPVETPVEILFKPKPAYTAEAREKKIEGEVLLEVQFSANGQVRVLRLIRGLGYGLDENARTAAGQIRFHPGTRNGSPVDMTGTVHIYFELS
jgi:TonB family protein